MEWVILFFLGLSLYLYCLLGGADFGVGVHELFIHKDRREHEDVVKDAMGPVWEANHMWLIIVVVILFVGFPRIYAQASTYLHIPITLMLIGIIFRGCAFTFRHYDSVEDQSRKYYTMVFAASSFLTPIMLGVIIGACMLGRVTPQPVDYFASYVASWFNLFSFSVGFFVLSIFTFVAGVFMIGEQNIGSFREKYVQHAKISHIIMIIAGALVFVAAEIDGLALTQRFVTHPWAIGMMVLATVSHIFLWWLFDISRAWRLRFLTGFQLLMIVGAWMAVIFPHAIFYNDGTTLTFLGSIAPYSTQVMLGYALMIGSVIFLPLLGYLFFVFKRSHE